MALNCKQIYFIVKNFFFLSLFHSEKTTRYLRNNYVDDETVNIDFSFPFN